MALMTSSFPMTVVDDFDGWLLWNPVQFQSIVVPEAEEDADFTSNS